ncbi:serine/arginine-rich splicing factor 7-like [Carassius auratus]|uniref:Serine/arginine-rich splicing factor 7-like n=1 Tax=Carassius auratus TaxID=7957 RepID=A0A6P6L002_CARAU|nr:serine/arginine-rich splicing factor 7-like [Carassius auratus]
MSRHGRHGGGLSPLPETKVYVGNLGTGAGKGELERVFSFYGPLRTVWIARNPPGFAFVEFEDPRDAEDAVRGLDGKIPQQQHVLITGVNNIRSAVKVHQIIRDMRRQNPYDRGTSSHTPSLRLLPLLLNYS